MKTQPTAKHTQGEWKTDGNRFSNQIAFKVNGVEIGVLQGHSPISDEENEANAARIVKCVNMHDEMLQCLKDLLDAYPSKSYTKVRELIKRANQL